MSLIHSKLTLDAAKNGCVDVKIRLHHIETETIPDLKQLKKNLRACHAASKKETPKAEIFFRGALDELGNTKANVLEISDYNTHGMEGPSENGTPYYAFMKAKGQSRKDSSTAAGSYGIGKFAPYTVSRVRAIFVSTVFQDRVGKYQQYTQGKSILMSHDLNRKRKQGVGFWGVKDKCQPVVGVRFILPRWLRRAGKVEELPGRQGSTLSVICFEESEHWEEYLAISVAENFFGAISAGKLCIDINEKYILDKTYICNFLGDEDIRELVADERNEPDQFDNSGNYLAALQDDDDVLVEESQMQVLGHVQMRILVKEGLPKRICVLRSGMFITDKLDGLKTFSDFKDFAAVVRCQSKEGNELLRAMEPPRHNDFEPERLPTRAEQKKGKRALKELARWVRDMLKRHAKDPVSEVTEIDELKQFFFEEGEDGSGQGTEDINPYGEILIHAKPIKMKIHESNRPREGAEGGRGEEIESGRNGSGSGSGDGPGRAGDSARGIKGSLGTSITEVHNVRTIMSGGRKRQIGFTPVADGIVLLRLMEAGADSDYDISVVNTDVGSIKEGGVVLRVAKGIRSHVCVELSHDSSSAIKVVAYEV